MQKYILSIVIFFIFIEISTGTDFNLEKSEQVRRLKSERDLLFNRRKDLVLNNLISLQVIDSSEISDVFFDFVTKLKVYDECVEITSNIDSVKKYDFQRIILKVDSTNYLVIKPRKNFSTLYSSFYVDTSEFSFYSTVYYKDTSKIGYIYTSEDSKLNRFSENEVPFYNSNRYELGSIFFCPFIKKKIGTQRDLHYSDGLLFIIIKERILYFNNQLIENLCNTNPNIRSLTIRYELGESPYDPFSDNPFFWLVRCD